MTDFDNFIKEDMVPKTAEYVLNFIKNTPVEQVPLFYYDVIISLGLAEMPSKEKKMSAIEEHEGDIDAAKRSIMNEIINNIKNNQ
jgi:hypothetical protein